MKENRHQLKINLTSREGTAQPGAILASNPASSLTSNKGDQVSSEYTWHADTQNESDSMNRMEPKPTSSWTAQLVTSPPRAPFRMRGGDGAKLAAALSGLAAVAVMLAALLAQPESSNGPRSTNAAATSAVGSAGSEQSYNQTGVLLPSDASLDSSLVDSIPSALSPSSPDVSVRVYLSGQGIVETLPLEQYIVGVLAAEMPAEFELEALKAQAIAARTYIVRRLAGGDVSGVPAFNADVTNTVAHQAYLSKEQLNEWAKQGKSEQLAKLEKAVQDTSGMIITYQGQPIIASFFSASGGYTENSEEYWSSKVPYLRSVPSPWEKEINPKYKETVTISLQDMFSELGLSAPAMTTLATQEQQSTVMNKLVNILSFTTGHKVKELSIDGTRFTGREVREKLKLRSSQFTFKLDGEQVEITTYGYGHGVGMSQWGANGMAKEGYNATQILRHYYKGISFRQASNILKT